MGVSGVSFPRLLYRMYFAPDGIFGTIATISSTFVALFVLFGAFLLRSGAGDFMIRLALALLGRTVGGPAKMAVFASGMLGFNFGKCGGEYGGVGFAYDSDDEAHGLFAYVFRRGRGGGIYGRSTHAADYGCGRVYYESVGRRFPI